MSWKNAILVIFFGIFKLSYGKYGFKGDQEWGFTKIRNEAYMFHWLHYTTANVTSYTERPLIIWLQGGPGVSSTGYGNFEEIGPLNLNLTKRQHSLVNDYNVLFIDSPVGTGYSFINSENALAKTEDQVVKDLFYCTDNFIKKFPAFSKVATYIIGESYGGKIAAHLASALFKASELGYDIVNLKGLALGDALISPIDSALSWAPYLYENRLIDYAGYKTITQKGNQIKTDVAKKNWKLAYQHFHGTVNTVLKVTPGLDFYNIHSKVDPSKRNNFAEVDKITKNLMETKVKPALNLPLSVPFNINNIYIKNALAEDFMKPVTEKVEFLLNKSKLRVFIFNGELDLLVNPLGTQHWIKNLEWKNVKNWLNAKKYELTINNNVEGYVKTFGNLRMYWIKGAGHMVPSDNPVAINRIIQDLTSNFFTD